MATESPIRILEGTNTWTTLKPSNSYRPSSAEMAIESLGLFLKEQRLHGSQENGAVPTRSESAPPSMEGSMAAIGGMFSQKLEISGHDPSSSSLSNDADFNLNQRFKRPVRHSDADGSAQLPRTSLPAHKEESKDDQLSEKSVSVRSSNVLSVSLSEKHMYQTKEPPIPLNNMLQHQTVPQESNSYRVEGSYPRANYPGTTTHPYGTLTHPFQYGSTSSVPGQESQPTIQSPGFKPPLFTTTAAYMTPAGQYYPNMQQAGYFHPQYNMPYNFNSSVLPSYMGQYSQQGGVPMAFNGSDAYDPQNLMKYYSQVGMHMQPQYAMQYLQPSLHGTYGRFDHPQTPRDGSYMTQMSPRDSRREELVGIGSELKPHNPYNLNLVRGTTPSHYPYGGSAYTDPSMQFPAQSIVSPIKQAKPETGTNFSRGRYYNSFSHSSLASPSTSSRYQNQSWNEMNSYSLLEELKSGKGQRYTLSDVSGHIYEFSIDQHGSRFIQQQLETCSDEEKASVFEEVVPHASKLMIDVFGNYVIQKLFEYGSPEQRENLASQLKGQILQLSMQMYGCRVIQKALDVIDLEQKVKLVRELDGNVIKCVRDQNGNHVIQKCIESIPSEKIDFIISAFRGQVAALSMHPYGCRVIQRVLEHSGNESHTQFIIDEILESVCTLAQDQYGNYVTQHVLERGKPRERTEIIEKLAGSVVQLSQHKFASNVVEKCLEYSDSNARDLLIKEIIGDDDKNDNLLTMMKDQYANYVIQKILQKCSNNQREVLLGLVRNHLTALKKYTYGKHIVARFEQICGPEETQETGP